jgi:hypothetical protein
MKLLPETEIGNTSIRVITPFLGSHSLLFLSYKPLFLDTKRLSYVLPVQSARIFKSPQSQTTSLATTEHRYPALLSPRAVTLSMDQLPFISGGKVSFRVAIDKE